MAIHPNFPKSPHEVLPPEYRWFPADEALRESSYEKLLPPLVHKIRQDVSQWRDTDYEGATDTSRALLHWWFKTEHIIPQADGSLLDFKYYFAQREALETVIYLYEVVKVKDKYDLIRFDSSGTVSAGFFDEDWLRLVIKMATGSGKTKVMSLIIAWCYFHKLYEPDSKLATNFLVIAPNIIVLDRLRADFDGLKIFFKDPLLPDNGYEGQNWQDDFQLTLHIQDAILTIHTNNNGEISEADSKKSKEELEILRKAANSIDSWESPYKVIISVLMLKEGWDVRNVTTIVGLRAYAAKSNILPEQTLGRGLCRMYVGADATEYVSVVGTDAFMDFVESIKSEGVELERKPMGAGTGAKTPIVIEVDHENDRKNIEKLDMQIPVMTPRMYRNYKNLEEIDPANFNFRKVDYKQYTEEEKREIIFKDITSGETNHVTYLESNAVGDYRSVIGYFTQGIMKELRLVSGYDVLYPKLREFIAEHLFKNPVDIDDLNTLRNLSESGAAQTIMETFKTKINELTVQDKGSAEIKDYIKLRQTRPFVAKEQGYLVPQKSLFNKIIGDSNLELQFASALEKWPDVISFAKNYLAVHFTLDYVDTKGDISNYYPDFFVKTGEKDIFVVETKGLEEIDAPLKMERLKKWCADINQSQKIIHFDFVFSR